MIRIKNNTSQEKTWVGQIIQPGEYYTVQDVEWVRWASDSILLTAIGNSEAIVNDGMVDILDINEAINFLKGIHAEPAYTFDKKQFVQATSRPLGTIAYFTSVGDSTENSLAVGGGVKMCYTHHIGDDADYTMLVNFNMEENRTYIREGYISYRGMNFDSISVDVVPRTTKITSGTNTFFNLYGGYLIVPAAGTGTIQLAEPPQLVECPLSVDTGKRDGKGFWNAPYNTETHSYGDLTACPYGDGTYNMFATEVSLSKFVNDVTFFGNGQMSLSSSDSKQLPAGTLLKISCHTDSTADHEWSAALILSLFRERLA